MQIRNLFEMKCSLRKHIKRRQIQQNGKLLKTFTRLEQGKISIELGEAVIII